jgi:cytoskeletal protein RodZ
VNSKNSDQNFDGGAHAAGDGGTLGEQLRRAREARGVSLREISEQTRITMRHLEAIEADDYKHLPGGIFNRSFVKAYARHVNFDEQRALDLYARTARERGESTEEAPTTPQRSRVYTGETTRPPLVTAALSALMIGFVILVGYAGIHYIRRGGPQPQEAPTPTPAAAAEQQQAGPAPAPTPAPQPEGFSVQVRSKRAIWLTSWQDTEKKRGRFLVPDKPEEFTPGGSLNLFFDKVSADALEVTVNGQPLKPPTSDAKEITWTITKDNYRQYTQ